MRIPVTGYTPPTGWASKLCVACVSRGSQDLPPMQVHFQRDATEDYATVVYTCRRCPHQDIGPQVPLAFAAQPSGHIFGMRASEAT